MTEIPEEGMCLEQLFPGTTSTVRCTLSLGHDEGDEPTLHHDEDENIRWGSLSAVDAIVEP